MPDEHTASSQEHLPLILIRGFGGLDVTDEKRDAYQGFNEGTVYHQKRGENYIYEGLILRFMKSQWAYQDATNVVGYYSTVVKHPPKEIAANLGHLPEEFFSGHQIVLDPRMASLLLDRGEDLHRTLWVFRYYDLDNRKETNAVANLLGEFPDSTAIDR